MKEWKYQWKDQLFCIEYSPKSAYIIGSITSRCTRESGGNRANLYQFVHWHNMALRVVNNTLLQVKHVLSISWVINEIFLVAS